MVIESYTFGKMIIDGKRYTSYLAIYPDARHWLRWHLGFDIHGRHDLEPKFVSEMTSKPPF